MERGEGKAFGNNTVAVCDMAGLAKLRVERSNTQKLSAELYSTHMLGHMDTTNITCTYTHTCTCARTHADPSALISISNVGGSPTTKVGKSSSKKQLSATLPCGGLNEKCPPQALISESQPVMLFVEVMQPHWRKRVTEGRM